MVWSTVDGYNAGGGGSRMSREERQKKLEERRAQARAAEEAKRRERQKKKEEDKKFQYQFKKLDRVYAEYDKNKLFYFGFIEDLGKLDPSNEVIYYVKFDDGDSCWVNHDKIYTEAAGKKAPKVKLPLKRKPVSGEFLVDSDKEASKKQRNSDDKSNESANVKSDDNKSGNDKSGNDKSNDDTSDDESKSDDDTSVDKNKSDDDQSYKSVSSSSSSDDDLDTTSSKKSATSVTEKDLSSDKKKSANTMDSSSNPPNKSSQSTSPTTVAETEAADFLFLLSQGNPATTQKKPPTSDKASLPLLGGTTTPSLTLGGDSLSHVSGAASLKKAGMKTAATMPPPASRAATNGNPNAFTSRSEYLSSIFRKGTAKKGNNNKPVPKLMRANVKGTRKVGTHPASEKQQMDEKVRMQYKLSLKHDEKLMNMTTPISKMDNFVAQSYTDDELKMVIIIWSHE
jgi:hypothetical protein